jgi:hypothetical protein
MNRVEHEALGGQVEEREARLNVFCKYQTFLVT